MRALIASGASSRPVRLTVAVLAALLSSAALAHATSVINGVGSGVVNGTSADDAIYAGSGTETINAGAGNDTIYPGPGPDTVSGGAGVDAVVYTGATPVDVSLDNKANDGAAGQDQNIESDVEDIYGGDGADTLIGDAADNTIDGGGGNDYISGGGGNNALYGGPGNDTIDARNGKQDVIDCGPGDDTVIADAKGVDIIAKDCENVEYPPTHGHTAPPVVGAIKESAHQLILLVPTAHSSVIVACDSGCKPSSPPSRALLSVRSVNSTGAVTFTLPKQIVPGATFEVGGKAGKQSPGCRRWHLYSVNSLKELKGSCVSVARTGR